MMFQGQHLFLVLVVQLQGQDSDLDIAMQLWPSIVKFLRQNDGELASFTDSVEALKNLIGGNK